MKAEATPKISVIMPVFNGEQYIEQALDSLLAQSYEDWELIIIDDGSTDSTPRILERYTDSRIRVIRQKNGGEANARNTGLKHMRGEYMAFLDADDIYLPNALTDLSSFLDQHPDYGVVYSNGQICDSDSNPLMTLDEIRPGFYTGNVLEQVVISSSVVTVPVCTMTRRSQICENSIQFDRNLVIGPDWDFWIQLAVHTGFGYLDKMTCRYRVHSMNITRTIDLKKRKRDQIYGRLKVMNSEWFSSLSLTTRKNFFFDLLINLASGNANIQTDILQSKQFSTLPKEDQAYLWRMVGVDVMQTDSDKDHALHHLRESLRINPDDRKTKLIYRSLKMGRSFTLALVKFWRLMLYNKKRFTSPDFNRSMRLQKLFGLR